ncbi:MAG: flagellar filament outer layer protein FlaA [Spirochaetota bacterium]|nr:flagellar filament outer layer protein FlaA [Spirochaetota bacterium]
MKKICKIGILALLLISFLLLGTLGIAQNAGDEPDMQATADEELVTYILDDFERASSWIVDMPRDQGVIFSMQRDGAPAVVLKAAETISNENARFLQQKTEQGVIPRDNPLVGFPYGENKYVLGVRVEFLKRGSQWFTVRPPLPIKIPGISKSISVYVVGRGYNHSLWLMLRDYEGSKRFISSMRPLTHLGWRRVLFPIKSNILQGDYRNTDPRKIGITFDGFLINCDPLEAQGTYYIYFDLLTAQVNLYYEFQADKDDMRDYW